MESPANQSPETISKLDEINQILSDLPYTDHLFIVHQLHDLSIKRLEFDLEETNHKAADLRRKIANQKNLISQR